MKLFNEGTSKNQNKYKFKGFYSFKIISDSKSNEGNCQNKNSNFKSYLLANNQPINSTTSFMTFSQKEKAEYAANESTTSLELNNDPAAYYDKVFQNQMSKNITCKTAPTSNIENNNFTNSAFPETTTNLNNLSTNKLNKKPKLIKIHLRSLKHKKSIYNIGRWTEDEHRRFIEAILKYGNDWKNVQKHIRTRSSTQSRSHSQKFFLKIKNYDLFDFKDRKPCISSLNELAKNLDEQQIEKMTDLLISYEYQDNPERKQNQEKLLLRKRKKEVYAFDFDIDNESSINNKTNNAFNYNNSFLANNKISKSGSFNLIKQPIIYEPQQKMNEFSVINNYNNANNNNNDDFKDHFFNAFNSRKNRRLSFEDNLLLLFRNAILDEESNVNTKFSIYDV